MAVAKVPAYYGTATIEAIKVLKCRSQVSISPAVYLQP
jgi:hypothetical protein